MAQTVNSDNKVADLLLELKRHLRVCRNCERATKVRDSALLCDHTVDLVISIARRYDTVIPRRIAARKSGDGHVFPCPDVSAHGKTHALIVEPMLVTGVQGALF